MNKSQIVLMIYDRLNKGEQILLVEIMNEFDISLSTFRRYISEINIFLSDTYQNKVVYYVFLTNSYYLKEI